MNFKAIAPVLGMMGLLLVVHCLPESIREQGIYLWDAPQRGEPWRWITAHFIHRSGLHLLVNLTCWALAALFLSPVLSAKKLTWWGIVLVAIAISVSFTLDPDGRKPFVGSSALFYAWLVAGCMKGAKEGPARALYGVVLAFLLLKGLAEAFLDAGLGLGELMRTGEVARRTHLHALAWGLIWGGCALFTARKDPRRGEC